MLRPLALIAVLGPLAACGKPASTASAPDTAPAAPQTAKGWLIYEDNWIRVAYPEGSEVAGAPDGKQDLNSPTFGVVPPKAGDQFMGAFTLQLDSKTKGMLLRDAIQSEIKSTVVTTKRVLAPPRDVKVGNGRCLSSLVTWPFDRCPKDQGTCYSAAIKTLCDDYAGRRYLATTMLSRGTDPNRLSPQAQQEAAVYERILRSLEFKKS